MPCPKFRILEQHRVHQLMQAIPCPFLGRHLELRNMLGHRGFPLGQFLVTAVQAQAQRETHRATDIEAGDRVMVQGVAPSLWL